MADDYTTDADDYLDDFVDAARRLVSNWEAGGLAEAVRELSDLLAAYDDDRQRPEGKTFGEWAKWHALVDAAVQARAGVSLADLPDVPLRDWYDAGVLPHVAAEDALREAGWGEGDEDETFDERVR